MPDVEKILRLVAEGALTPEEADEILNALNAPRSESDSGGAQAASSPAAAGQMQSAPRHLRIEVTERGQRVVNLRVPINLAGWASHFLPGLSEQDTDHLRGAIASGVRGPLIDIGDGDDRVIITTE